MNPLKKYQTPQKAAVLIRRLARQFGFNPYYMAEKIGVGRATYWRWENGKGTPSLDSLNTIFEYAERFGKKRGEP